MSSPNMISSKRVIGLLAGFAISALVALPASATQGSDVSITINNGTALSLWAQGTFSYDGSSLLVQTDGPLFCANAGTPAVPQRSILLTYHDSEWQLPSASDLQTLSYGSGSTVLKINQGITGSSLVCHSINAAGQVPSPYADGLFYQGFDDAGFNQTLPRKHTEVAVDVYTAGTTSCSGGDPSATCMDVREYLDGGQEKVGYTFEFGATINSDASGITVPVTVRDAYHGHYLGADPGNQSDFGDYCVSTTPFSDLTAPCPGAPSGNVTVTGPIPAGDGIVYVPFDLSEVSASIVRYVLVHRYVTASGLPQQPAPIVAAAIFVGQDVPGSIDTGDAFVGDDVTFGCWPVGGCGQRSGGQY
ncbi:MAG: hypothetical protein WB784_06630 [Rhodanobacteraceae bacterium]